MTSNVTISALRVVGQIGSINIEWDVTDPNARGHSYLRYKQAKVYKNTVDNFSTASLLTTVVGMAATYGDLLGVQGFYFWVVPVDAGGTEGARFPPAGGVYGATLSKVAVERLEANLVWTIGDSTPDPAVKINFSGDNSALHGIKIIGDGGGAGIHLDLTGGVSGIYGDFTGSARGIEFNFMSGSGTGVFVQNYGTGPCATFLQQTNTPAQYSTNNAGGPALAAASYTGGVGTYAVGATKDTGGFCFYAVGYSGASGYGPFTGAHDALIPLDDEAESGDVVCDRAIIGRVGISETISEVARSSFERDRTALGVLASRGRIPDEVILAALPVISDEIRARCGLAVVNSLGEGQINVCDEGGPIQAGDYLVTSNRPGKARAQGSEMMLSCTVARAREPAQFNENGLAQIACIYHCG